MKFQNQSKRIKYRDKILKAVMWKKQVNFTENQKMRPKETRQLVEL